MKHPYLTMYLPHPSTPDYVYHKQEMQDRRDQLQREVDATDNRVPFNFAEYYPNISGVIVEEPDGSVREINKYEIFYEDGIDEQSAIAWFVLDALAAGFTLAAPPLVLPNTKPGQHYKNGVTIYFFLEVPPHKLSEEAKKSSQQNAQHQSN